MPSAYTEIIEDGCTFEDYVWRCAQGFLGPFDLREDGLRAPKDLKPGGSLFLIESETKRLEEALIRLAELFRPSNEDIEAQAAAENARRRELAARELARENDLMAKYDAMEKAIRDWDCPYECRNLQQMMLKQISDSRPVKPGEYSFWATVREYTADEYYEAEFENALETVKRQSERLLQLRRDRKERVKWFLELEKSVPRPGVEA